MINSFNDLNNFNNALYTDKTYFNSIVQFYKFNNLKHKSHQKLLN